MLDIHNRLHGITIKSIEFRADEHDPGKQIEIK